MRKIFLVALAAGIILTAAVVAVAAGPTGAIFTTTPDGSIVNENVRYDSKLEVYLDGGPGPNAPQTAAGLDDGEYVFQVTDPSGKFLLSEDPAKCRVVEVSDGVIVGLVNPSATYTNKRKTVPCHIQDEPDGVAGKSGRHDTNTDVDHGPPAIVVQLMPYGTTPNPGGVYKAWMTPIDRYVEKSGDLENVPTPVRGKAAHPCPDFCAESDPGFKHPDVKTDNFKVKHRGKFEAPLIFVQKFHDKNFNGIKDAAEEDVTGWEISIFDPVALVTDTVFTPVIYLAANVGTYEVTEDMPAGTIQTVSHLDGVTQSLFPAAHPLVTVPVSGKSGETHTVVYGNVGLGEVEACKVYDADGDGSADPDEAPVAGWRMQLSGTLANGSAYPTTVQSTGADGCTNFSGLLPGSYTVTELIPSTGGWTTAGAVSQTVVIGSTLSGATMSGGTHTVTFANFCVGSADFGTKGYWHNKNGLAELTLFDILAVNLLAPYSSPSSYFGDGDEPFDGTFSDGTLVSASLGESGELIAPPGSFQAEVSQFLVDPNAGGDPREQLAQQLLAFIFNVQHRLDGGTTIQLPDGSWANAADIIDAAIDAWLSPDTADDNPIALLLDALNNSDAVPFVHAEPCEVVYP